MGLTKLAEAGAAECRKAGAPDENCVMPAGHDNLGAERAAYANSWVHRAAQFQYRLGSSLPLRDAQWLGTHNSFNSFANGETVSHLDSNQQLSLAQQLDLDIRSLELDLHWIRSAHASGSEAAVVCHGRGAEEQHAGCTTEPLLSDVLPELATWLDADGHRDQVLLLYLEDNLGNAAGYAQAVAQLEAGLKRADGSSLIFHPDPADRTDKGCTNLPLDVSRDDVVAAGAQVVMVGNCRSGWAVGRLRLGRRPRREREHAGLPGVPRLRRHLRPARLRGEDGPLLRGQHWLTATVRRRARRATATRRG